MEYEIEESTVMLPRMNVNTIAIGGNLCIDGRPSWPP